jgi:hypothetical protein
MAGPSRVTDPDGKVWTVRRRWFPWRRAISLRALWHSTPTGHKPDDDAKPSESSDLHPVLAFIGVLIWLLVTAGKAVLILLAAVVAITLSVTDLIVRLIVMPFVLLARACGVMRWPVQVDREHQFVRTEFADGYNAAAVLRDGLSTTIHRGELTAEPAKA